jgi:hypothetical protein
MARQISTARALPHGEQDVTTMRKRGGACPWKLRARGVVEEVRQAREIQGLPAHRRL